MKRAAGALETALAQLAAAELVRVRVTVEAFARAGARSSRSSTGARSSTSAATTTSGSRTIRRSRPP